MTHVEGASVAGHTGEMSSYVGELYCCNTRMRGTGTPDFVIGMKVLLFSSYETIRGTDITQLLK